MAVSVEIGFDCRVQIERDKVYVGMKCETQPTTTWASLFA